MGFWRGFSWSHPLTGIHRTTRKSACTAHASFLFLGKVPREGRGGRVTWRKNWQALRQSDDHWQTSCRVIGVSVCVKHRADSLSSPRERHTGLHSHQCGVEHVQAFQTWSGVVGVASPQQVPYIWLTSNKLVPQSLGKLIFMLQFIPIKFEVYYYDVMVGGG